MSWLGNLADVFWPQDGSPSSSRPATMPQAYLGLDDPVLADILTGGLAYASGSGARVNQITALRNTSVLRCVTLISNALGRLPLHLLDGQAPAGADNKAVNHPLYNVLWRKPNDFQTAFEFRRLMQRRVLVDGNAYALPIRSARGQIVALIPIAPERVRLQQNADWSITYHVTGGTTGGDSVTGTSAVQYDGKDIFHLRGMSACGLIGDSLVRQANESIGLALTAERAAARVFLNGSLVGGVLSLPAGKTLSPEGIVKLRGQFEAKTGGSENAGKWTVAEDGMTVTPLGMTAKDSQNLETRKMQIEEIARVFGIPRPFLMVDDTSWGTGIEQLGIYLVQHCLAPWFEAWEQAIWRTLLTPAEQGRYQAKFNEAALLRGSMASQAEYLRMLVGTGQGPQIMEVNEARDALDLGEHADGDGLSSGMGTPGGAEPMPDPAKDNGGANVKP